MGYIFRRFLLLNFSLFYLFSLFLNKWFCFCKILVVLSGLLVIEKKFFRYFSTDFPELIFYWDKEKLAQYMGSL